MQPVVMPCTANVKVVCHSFVVKCSRVHATSALLQYLSSGTLTKAPKAALPGYCSSTKVS